MTSIETYLADLARRLRLPDEAAARLLEEIETHLSETAEAAVSAGVPADEAEHEAVRRCGPAAAVAWEANGAWGGVLARAVAALAPIAALGCVAVLAGTLLAWAAALATSVQAVFGLPSGARASSAAVAHWLAVQPGAATWQQAAAWENADDSLVLRAAAALLGLAACVLAGLVVPRRYRRTRRRPIALAAAALFAGAAAALLLDAVTGRALLDWGRGQALADGAAAAVTAVALAVVGVRRPTEASGRAIRRS